MSNTLHRIGTATMYDNTVRNLHARQSALAQLEENVSAGKRVLRPSDDPIAAAQAERALARISQLQAEHRALEQQQGRIAQAETALGDAIDVVQQIRELVLGAGNGANQPPHDHHTYANQIRHLREQLLEIVNRKDTSGQPLLGGLGSALTPFTGGDRWHFNGLPGQVGSGENAIASSLDGHAALMFDPVRDGIYHAHIAPRGAGSSLTTSPIHIEQSEQLNGASFEIHIDRVVTLEDGRRSFHYTITRTESNGNSGVWVGALGPVAKGQPMPLEITVGGGRVTLELLGEAAEGDTIHIQPSHSLMESIDNAVGGIGGVAAAPPTNTTDSAQAIGQALSGIDAGLERLRQVRSHAGELLGRAERLQQQQSQRGLQLEAERSNAEDLDLLQATSELQNARIAHQVALQSYAQVQRLSLFDYLR